MSPTSSQPINIANARGGGGGDAGVNYGGSTGSTGPGWNLSATRRDRKLWTTLRERIEADVEKQLLTSVELEEILRQLLVITIPNSRIRGDELAAVIVALCRVVPLSSELLCSEFTRFVHKACLKDKVVFTEAQLQVAIGFFLSFIKKCASWYTAGTIRALGTILHENADRVTPDEFDQIFAVLLKYLDPAGVDIEARYAATSCASNISTQAAKTPEVHRHFAALLRMVVENFRQQSLSLTKGENERILVKACTCSMKCIYTIINSNYDRLGDRIEPTLPSLLNAMRQVVGQGLVLKHERDDVVFTCNEELLPSDSDSSVCGSDGGGSSAGSNRGQPGEGLLARLRITVLHTLEAIADHFPRAVTSSMGLYLPEQTTPYMTLYNNAPSVLTLLLADPCERVRIAAAKFLDAFWEKIPLKQYFRHSSSVVAPSTSFASMPKRISYMLYQVHVTLVYSIQNEKDSAPLVQALKTAASVIQHCPYASVTRLLDQSDLQPPVGDVLRALASSLYVATSSTDHSVRMASLSCFSSLLNVQDPLPALLDWMIAKSNTKSIIQIAHITILCGAASLSKRSFVEELLQIASRPDDTSRSLMRLEAMSLLSKIAKNYSSALSVHWKRLSEFMLCAFQDMDPNVRLQAVKILENYIKGESVLASDADTTEDGENNGLSTTMALAVTPVRQECLNFMSTHLIRAFHDTSHHVRASVCACYTLLRTQDWLYLKERPSTSRLPAARNAPGTPSLDSYTRVFLQTPKDSSPVVRAAGFRLLGSLCLVPAFKTRELSIAVVAAAVDALGDSTLNVRVRAAWALGNVCTTPGPEAVPLGTTPLNPLVDSVTTPQAVLYEILPAYQLRSIVEKMLVCIGDNDKVASSVARTLGLVCRWAFFDAFVQSVSPNEAVGLQDLLGQTMVVLATKINAGSPKVRWNACHAIAKVLLCPSLPLASVHWAPAVFQALICAVAQQENFKVRISACSALRVPVSRHSYGSFFRSALTTTLDALETASDLKDVTEFRYKEQLETQLSFTLVHLIHVATEEDDALIWQAISGKPPTFLYDWVFHNLHRMCAIVEKEAEAVSGNVEAMEDGAEGGGCVGMTEMHDVHPIKKDEILSAVCTIVRILQRDDHARVYASSCLSILYDAKLSLERDVLYSNEDLAFEF
ncbi:hypothetical protein Poli38472_002415 [Pythium oligandrum]|uniref:DUF4042 domain-containing protein n=1 Tax=Pythium oligandrum TaxID=41045 RepID=A0A8K1CH51_PYTOL|nr:hypothetical protein Poli38472_002415 [Pythium oligandrum]|eukprot:TMW63474.1 hypothetical protein Poli38472_002415 [Pythium oligandrum]